MEKIITTEAMYTCKDCGAILEPAGKKDDKWRYYCVKCDEVTEETESPYVDVIITSVPPK